jgi:hypothetical protein
MASRFDVVRFMRETVEPLKPTELIMGSAIWWHPSSSQSDEKCKYHCSFLLPVLGKYVAENSTSDFTSTIMAVLSSLAKAAHLALRAQNGTAYWKTKTMSLGEQPAHAQLFDEAATRVMSSFGWQIFDVQEITAHGFVHSNPALYWNEHHYHCKVHNLLNYVLMEAMQGVQTYRRKSSSSSTEAWSTSSKEVQSLSWESLISPLPTPKPTVLSGPAPSALIREEQLPIPCEDNAVFSKVCVLTQLSCRDRNHPLINAWHHQHCKKTCGFCAGSDAQHHASSPFGFAFGRIEGRVRSLTDIVK